MHGWGHAIKLTRELLLPGTWLLCPIHRRKLLSKYTMCVWVAAQACHKDQDIVIFGMDCLCLIEQCTKSQQERYFKDLTVAFSVVCGMTNALYDMILKKKLARSPLLELPVFFIPVECMAEIIFQAGKKLSEGDADIVAISFKLVGYWRTIKEFHNSLAGVGARAPPISSVNNFILCQFVYSKIFGKCPSGC